jgi:hypothetical protein
MVQISQVSDGKPPISDTRELNSLTAAFVYVMHATLRGVPATSVQS